jgi:hypothetical protein
LLEPTPEGRHYNEFGAGGAAVILVAYDLSVCIL